MDSKTAQRLRTQLDAWGQELGFQQIGVAPTDLSEDEGHLLDWLARGFHGEMEWMERHGTKRSRPADLVPGTIRIISARMDYLPPGARDGWDVLGQPDLAFVSRYALGRDYHKVLRGRLAILAKRIDKMAKGYNYRAFTDSAPVLEKALARNAGLGWIGKHSNLLNEEAGSWFFLGEIYTDLPLPIDAATEAHCGSCRRCIDACPTGAIVAPFQVDARRCISYLTIEHASAIPEDLRPLLGNRIYGCDDCQLVCPFNKFAEPSSDADFAVREDLDSGLLIDLFAWSEEEFLRRTEGSAIRRIGHERWLRNIAVALGNAPGTPQLRRALLSRRNHPSELVREHVRWALAQHES